MGVSLIIPNYNNAPYLRQCIVSALEQTLPFEEIIVVDDGSQDNSLEVIEAVAAQTPLVRLLRREQRGGVARARHDGIEVARSTHITTLDSDDFLWNTEKNAREWALVASGGEGRSIVAFSDIRRVSVLGDNLGSIAARRRVREGDVFWWLLFLRGFVPRDFTFSKAAYVEAGAYDPAFIIYEDWDLKLRLARIADFRFTGCDGVAYRNNPGGLSRAAFGHHFGKIRDNSANQYEPPFEPTLCFGLSGFIVAGSRACCTGR